MILVIYQTKNIGLLLQNIDLANGHLNNLKSTNLTSKIFRLRLYLAIEAVDLKEVSDEDSRPI